MLNKISPKQLLANRLLKTELKNFTALLILLAIFSAALSLPIFTGSSYPNYLTASITENLILNGVNPARQAAGQIPLRTNPQLEQAAKMKAQDMLARGYFAHYDPEGNPPWVWLKKVGYNFTAAGENLAIDFSDPESLVNAWLASPEHAENIHNELFSDVGVGIASGSFLGKQTNVVVMFLGKKISIASNASQTPPIQSATSQNPNSALAQIAPPAPSVQPTTQPQVLPQNNPPAQAPPALKNTKTPAASNSANLQAPIKIPDINKLISADKPLITQNPVGGTSVRKTIPPPDFHFFITLGKQLTNYIYNYTKQVIGALFNNIFK